MSFLLDVARAYGRAVKRAFPLLVVITIVLDALLVQSVKPSPLLNITFWFGVLVGGTFLIVTALYIFWLFITGSVNSRTAPQKEVTR